MPRDRPTPPPFEPTALDRSLDRYLLAGIVFMVVLVAGFIAYRVREPSLRADAATEQRAEYTKLGRTIFESSCAECHGSGGRGGSDAPTLASREFLSSTSDAQIAALVAGGITGTEMSAWGIEFGGTLTDEQIDQIVTYLRGLERDAPSIPDWRDGATAGDGDASSDGSTAPGDEMHEG